jgi:high-affinity Fe2+/Pb2+ permease
MNWIYILGLLLAVGIVGVLLYKYTYSDGFATTLMILGFGLFLLVGVWTGGKTIENQMKMAEISTTKIYSETSVSEGYWGDTSLGFKKYDLNRWLQSAKISKLTYGDWSLYPKDVLGIAPIQ